jgi:hypothetical protein
MELSAVEYDGRVFEPVGQPAGEHAVGRYSQDGALVWAELSGAHLRTGRLVGRRDADGTIDAGYCQVMADGRVVAGRCVSTPTVLPDGRLRLTEHWRRCDGTTGISLIEEVTS